MSLLFSPKICASAAFLFITAAGAPAFAEFPEKPVTINVGFGAGGGVDAITRAMVPALSDALGESVIVVNMPGAGGAVASTRLKSAEPDGYQLVATTSTTVTFDPHVGGVAFELGDFEYIAAVGTFPEALIALPSRGWDSAKEMLDEAKANGTALTYASNTAIDRMVAAALTKSSGVTINPVPVDGGAESVAQVLGGHVDFGYSSGTYYPQAVSGDVVILAALGEAPVPGFEDKPTLMDLGFDIASVNLIVFFAPKGIPDDARAELVSAFEAAAASATLQDVLAQRNMGSFVAVGQELDEVLERHSGQFRTLAATPN